MMNFQEIEVGRNMRNTEIELELARDAAPDIDAVVAMLDLSAGARDALISTVLGCRRGNPNRPIWRMVHTLVETGVAGFVHHIHSKSARLSLPREFALLPRNDRALLIFLLQIDARGVRSTVIDFCDQLAEIDPDAPSDGGERIRTAARGISARLDSYRSAVIPHERNRRTYQRIRRFLADHAISAPADGQATLFWHEIIADGSAGQHDLVRHINAVGAFADYAAHLKDRETIIDLRHSRDQAEAPVDMEPSETAEETLKGALDALEKADPNTPRILKKTERDELRWLAWLGDTAWRWPVTSLSALSIMPVQNRITQAMRDNRDAVPTVIAAETDRLSIPDHVLRDRIANIQGTCRDTLVITFDSGQRAGVIDDPGDVSAGLSGSSLLRRASFKSRPPAELYGALYPLIDALVGLKRDLTRIESAWDVACGNDVPDPNTEIPSFATEHALFLQGIRKHHGRDHGLSEVEQ